jgi:3-methyladenine DNA glycosylase AlkD
VASDHTHSAVLACALRRALRDVADPVKAPAMQAYMKSQMPYLGVQSTPLRKAAKAVFAAHPLATFEAWRDTVFALWRGALYREECYAAVELLRYPAYGKFRTLAALPLYEELITKGAWWDFVDAIAAHPLGELLRDHPAEMSATMRRWAVSDDLWKRRSAILAQLNFKADTDLELLYDCIRPSMDSKEFFLRKGIGWALRQYARIDAAEVLAYVRRYDSRLSPLTKREALKHCPDPSEPRR